MLQAVAIKWQILEVDKYQFTIKGYTTRCGVYII